MPSKKLTPEDTIAKNIEVVSGSPTPQELAVVIAVIEQAHQEELATGKRAIVKPKSTWVKNSSMLRSSVVAGFGQWRSSFKDGL
jgi:hypothetical protein